MCESAQSHQGPVQPRRCAFENIESGTESVHFHHATETHESHDFRPMGVCTVRHGSVRSLHLLGVGPSCLVRRHPSVGRHAVLERARPDYIAKHSRGALLRAMTSRSEKDGWSSRGTTPNQRFTESRYVMVSSLPQPELVTAHPEPAIQRSATCPLCHTIDMSLSDDALAAGGGWRCTICGQRWDAPRLATVAAYAVWALERETVSRRDPAA